MNELAQSRLPGLAKLESAKLHCVTDLTEVPELIRRNTSAQTGYLVLSDQLDSESHDGWHGSLKEYILSLPNLPVVNVALTSTAYCLNDIDATVPVFATNEESSSTLRKAIRKLGYLFPPEPIDRRKVAVACRLLKTIDEFRTALRVRKNVYETMSYLDRSFLDTRSELELDWFDFNAVHFGAFLKICNGHEKLVGTARLILTKPPVPQSREWCNTILNANRSLRRFIDKQIQELASFKLAAFRSLALNELMRTAANSSRPWGELSRVIVKPQWRGHGYSKDIIENVISFAISKNVEAVLLECLEIHAPLYEGFGFSQLGQKAIIVGVGRTMVGMARHLIPAAIGV